MPDASTTRASLTTVAVAATMHHIKVPRGSKVSKVEVILSDQMSREPWSRDHAAMDGDLCMLEYRSLRIRRFNGTSSSFLPPIFPPFPLRLDRTSRFQICVFRFLSLRCFLGVVLLFLARSISRQRLPAPFFAASSTTACSLNLAAHSKAALFSLRFCRASWNVNRGATGVGLYIRPRTYDSQFSCLFVIRES